MQDKKTKKNEVNEEEGAEEVVLEVVKALVVG